MFRMIDLHVHTTASDGTYTPAETVRLAHKSGLGAMAITDHDTIDGVEEAVLEAEKVNLELVPGVEISVGDTDDIHILGLYVDIKNKELNCGMEKLAKLRYERNCEIIEKLQKEGFDITFEKVAQTMHTGRGMSKVHIAHYMKKTGIVYNYRVAFKKYLIPGAKAYVPKANLSEREGIELIRQSGGLPFLAHINYLRKDEKGIENTVKRLMEYGLAGVEAYYSAYDKNTEQIAHKICEKYNLLKSGGTDFHGAHRPGVYLGNGRGNLCIPYDLLVDIKKKL